MGGSALLRRWAKRSISRHQVHGETFTRSAMDVIGEQIGWAALALDPQTVIDSASIDDEPVARVLWSQSILMADATLWMDDILVETSRMALPKFTFSSKPYSAGAWWWTTEKGIGDETKMGTDDYVETHAFLLCVLPGNGILIVRAGTRGQDGVNRLEEIEPLGDGPVSAAHVDGLINIRSQLHAMLAFRDSPYIPKRKEAAADLSSRRGRHIKRTIDRKIASSTVSIIDMRLEHLPGASGPKAGDGEIVDWKHRWIVRGHLRAQWYPSLQAHRVIYVPPHVKGPEDKPLKTRVSRVIR